MSQKLLFIVFLLFLTLTNAFSQQDAVLYLMGRVVMEDGSPVSNDLRVELVCDARAIRQVFTSNDGTFSFDLGSVRQTNTVTDASASPQTGGLDTGFARSAWNTSGFNVVLGRVYLDACLVRIAPTAGLTADPIKLGIRGLMDNPKIGEILARKVDPAEASTVDVNIAAAPPKALEHLQKAKDALLTKKPNTSKASKELKKSVEIHPSFTEAWVLLGDVQRAMGDLNAARTSYGRAGEIDPDLAPAFLGLAQVELELQRWAEAAEAAERALVLDPDSSKGLFYSGLADYYLNRFDSSFKAFSKLEALGWIETYPVAVLHLGMLFAKAGKYDDSAQRLESYLQLEGEKIDPKRRRQIEAQLEHWKRTGLIQSPSGKEG